MVFPSTLGGIQECTWFPTLAKCSWLRERKIILHREITLITSTDLKGKYQSTAALLQLSPLWERFCRSKKVTVYLEPSPYSGRGSGTITFKEFTLHYSKARPWGWGLSKARRQVSPPGMPPGRETFCNI